jgi:hypothetical protein
VPAIVRRQRRTRRLACLPCDAITVSMSSRCTHEVNTPNETRSTGGTAETVPSYPPFMARSLPEHRPELEPSRGITADGAGNSRRIGRHPGHRGRTARAARTSAAASRRMSGNSLPAPTAPPRFCCPRTDPTASPSPAAGTSTVSDRGHYRRPMRGSSRLELRQPPTWRPVRARSRTSPPTTPTISCSVATCAA